MMCSIGVGNPDGPFPSIGLKAPGSQVPGSIYNTAFNAIFAENKFGSFGGVSFTNATKAYPHSFFFQKNGMAVLIQQYVVVINKPYQLLCYGFIGQGSHGLVKIP